MRLFPIHHKEAVVWMLCVLFIFISVISINAQIYDITTYGVKDGMSSGPKGNMIKDNKGYLWIGSTSGINRFDGHNFKLYVGDSSDSTSFQTYHSRNFIIDDNDNLWVVLSEGFYLYDKQKDKFVNQSLSMDQFKGLQVPNFTSGVIIDNKAYLSSIIGLHIYDINKKTWTYIDFTPGLKFVGHHHSMKSIWVINIDIYDANILHLFGLGRYYKFDIKNQQIVKQFDIKYKYNKHATISKALQIDEQQFWIGTYGEGFMNIDIESEETNYQLLDGNDKSEDPFLVIHDFIALDDEKFLLANLRGEAILFDQVTYSWQYFKPEGMYDQYSKTLKGDDGIIWIAGKAGLTKIMKKPFVKVSIPDFKNKNLYKGQITTDGKYAMITSSGPNNELFQVDSSGSKLTSTGWSQKGWSPKFDKNKNVYYFNDNDSLKVFDPYQQRITKQFRLENSSGYEFIDFYNEKIFTTKNHFVRMYSEIGQLLKEWDLSSIDILIAPRTLDHLTFQNDSIIYFHNANEIARINILSDEIKKITVPSTKMVIKDLFVVGKDLWIPNKYNTLIKLEWDSSKNDYLVKNIFNPNHYMNVGSCEMDNNEILWISNYNGLSAVDTKNNQTVLHIDGRDGLGSIDDEICETDKDIYITSEKDWIKISKDFKQPKLGNIQLEVLKIKGIISKKLHDYNVEHTDNDLFIQWTSPYFGRYDQLSYYFKLDGHDNDWQYNGSNNTAYYSNLSPGKYTFKVDVNALGQEKKIDLFSIEIKAPWWKTWWFYVFCLVLSVGFVYWFYQNRIEIANKKANIDKKIAQLEIKALRAQLNPHFIFNSLNSVKSLIQMDEKKQAVEYLVLFATMIRRVLDMSDQTSVSLREEIGFSTEYLRMENLRSQGLFEYKITIDQNIDMDFLRVPPMILQPHLENAIWHGIMPMEEIKGQIYIDITKEIDTIKLELYDNGIGRKASIQINEANINYKHKSKGTSLSVDRLRLSSLIQEHEITIQIIDLEPNGTKVIIRILN